MFSYSPTQWLLFFYIYSFVGWMIESTIVSIDEKRFVNRGFLRGPLLPLYGFGGIVILFVSLPVKDSPALVYLCGMLGTTILEYFTGWLMESLFKMKYWDYGGQKFSFKGRISLTSSLFWGFLSLFMTYGLHKWVQSVVFLLSENAVLALVISISVFFTVDTIHAFRTALDVKKLLARMNRILEEMEVLKEQLAEKVENSEYTISIKNRITELKAELGASFSKVGFFKTSLIKAHPGARSKEFNRALKALRTDINERMKRRKK